MTRRHSPRQDSAGTHYRFVAIGWNWKYIVNHHTSCALMVVMAGALSILTARAQQPIQQPGGTLPVKLQPVFREGVQALRAGELDRAAELFSEVVKDGGNTGFVHNNLGIAYQAQGKNDKAIAEFRRAMQLAPNYEAPHVLMGASLLALGRVSEAIKQLERATSLAPDEPRARLELGKAYSIANDPIRAVQQFATLRRLRPRSPEYAYQLGEAYLKLATRCVTLIREQNPKSARLYQIMARNYRAQGELDRAKMALEMAAQADPGLPGVHLEIASIDLQQGDPENARAEIQKELALVPESVAALSLQRRLEATVH